MGIIPDGMNFWNPWAVWEKLTLVLGSAIFFVLIIGFSVKIRNARRIRKLQAQAAADLAERGEVVQRLRTSEEVPFGIRAIEAGHEVNGIWNSRAATPLQAPSPKSFSEPGTPIVRPLKLKKVRTLGSESSFAKLDAPEPAHINSKCLIDAPPLSETSSNTIRPGPDAVVWNLLPGRTKAPSGKRRIIIGGRIRPQSEADKEVITSKPNIVDRMKAHRRHVTAETGQLEHRVKHAVSEEASAPSSVPILESGSDRRTSVTISWPSSKFESAKSSSTMKSEIVPLPSAIFSNVNSKRPPPTAWTQRTGELVDEKLGKAKLTPTVQPAQENPSHLNENHRQVNESFEILPAGSLAKLGQVKTFGSCPEPTIKVVVDNEANLPRKLRKPDRSCSRHRLSSDSSRSSISFAEGSFTLVAATLLPNLLFLGKGFRIID